MRIFAAGLALVLLASCQGETRVPDRLVSGDAYYSERSLQETIRVYKGFGGEGYGLHRLEYELRPNNELKVRYWLAPETDAVAEEGFDLSSHVADQFRRDLWRLRPESISENLIADWPTLPLNCKRGGPHDQGDIWVIFLPDADDIRGRVFELTRADSCDSLAAKQARLLIEEVIASLPNSKIAAEFHRAMSTSDHVGSWEDPKPIRSLSKRELGEGLQAN
ncbi:hypothetical protein [Altererythrobacter sp. MF3-039]|uniref:hypothetical protein n=1 Tax=Altererythrobacter sp. MF3-039 TaxID=3252901 RepID=UPI00390C5FE6